MEMKEELSVAEMEDAEEVKKWRSLSQSEIDQSCKNLAERMEEEVLSKYKVEESNKEAFQGRSAVLEWRAVRKKQEIQNEKVRKRLLGKTFLIQLAASAKQAG